VIDGDRAGHDALLNPAIKHRLHQRFGDAVFDQQGDVIRSELARRVFGSSRDAEQARADLERIVHPEIRQILAQQVEAARTAGEADAILLDAAVLLEAGWHDLCDALVFVETPEPIRRNRVLSSRNWTAEQLRQREESQLPLEQKRRAADFVIENAGSLTTAAAELERAVDQARRRSLGRSDGPPHPRD
jgi:dephospho-CoA kinase